MTPTQWAAIAFVVLALLVIFWRLSRRKSAAGSAHPEARTQHYIFAHYALRSAVSANPNEAMDALAAPRGQKVLESIWNDLGAEVQKKKGVRPIPSAGLSTTVSDLAGRRCALITLPAPAANTEAYLLAIVLDNSAPKPAVRYFTLERGFHVADNSIRTVLCEWTDSKHVNYGDGPPPNPQAFLAAVRDRLTAAPSP